MSDDRTEDALRRVLSIEAQQVQPTGDGLSRIQQRVDARQSRLRWLRPALAGAAAVIVVGGAVGGYAMANNGNGNQTVNVSSSDGPSPTAVPVASFDFPAQAIFPFSNVADEQAWQQQYETGGSMPWVTSPQAVAEYWVENYLKQPGLSTLSNETNGATSSITMGRIVSGNPELVTVVSLVQYQKAWIVTRAYDPFGKLQFSDPAPNTAVTSPLTVDGPGYGVDEQATIEIRDAETPDLFGQASTGPFGNGTAQWSASVPFTATSDAGVVVATVASAGDGKLATLTAEKVTFGPSSGRATTTSKIYAAESGTLVTLNPTTGASDGTVAAADAEGTIAEVHVVDDTVYFTAGTSTCATGIYSMPAAGGAPSVVSTVYQGYGITGFDITSDRSEYTYFASGNGCGGKAGSGELVFGTLSGTMADSVAFDSLPPVIVGDPLWEPDGVHIDAFVRTGMEGYLARYATTGGTTQSTTPNSNSCPGFDSGASLPGAMAEGPDGNLWVASQTGTSMQVVSCTGTKPTVEFTVQGNDTPTSLAINSQGQALLAGDGKVYEWNGHANAQAGGAVIDIGNHVSHLVEVAEEGQPTPFQAYPDVTGGAA